MLAVAATYLNLPGPNMMLVYSLVVTVVLIGGAMALFRGLEKWKEARQIRASSWRTFRKIAKVKGLSRLELDTLALVVRAARVDRPTLVMGSMTLFDRCIDKAADRDVISDNERDILERVREKLVRTTTKWDGRTNRRQVERANCAFEIQISLITKENLDEELKSTYEDDDPKFRTALEDLATQMPPVGVRMLDISAGGISLLAQDKEVLRPGDFLRLSPTDETLPFRIEGMVVRALGAERMDDQNQLVIHGAFLPYDQDLRKQIIQLVYAEPEKPAAKGKKAPRKKKAVQVRAEKVDAGAKKALPAKAEVAPGGVQDAEAPVASGSSEPHEGG